MKTDEPPITYASRRDIEPEQIRKLRGSVGWERDDAENWRRMLRQAYAVVSAWSGDALVGICFLIGSDRTVLVTDLVVHGEYQRRGIGKRLIGQALAAAPSAVNVFICYDEKSPWLEPYYRSFGFRPVGNCLRLKRDIPIEQ